MRLKGRIYCSVPPRLSTARSYLKPFCLLHLQDALASAAPACERVRAPEIFDLAVRNKQLGENTGIRGALLQASRNELLQSMELDAQVDILWNAEGLSQ